MTQFSFRPLALEDLQDLLTYIATENPQAALRMHDCSHLGGHLQLA